MRIQNTIALCSMILLAGATTIGANAQQIMQVNRTEIITPSAILTPGDNVVLLKQTQSAVIPGSNLTADIHTPSLLPPGTLMVHGLAATSCDTAIILPGMADMPSSQVLTINTSAATVPAAPAVQVEQVVPKVKETTTTTTTTKVYRQVRSIKKAPRKAVRRAVRQEVILK